MSLIIVINVNNVIDNHDNMFSITVMYTAGVFN